MISNFSKSSNLPQVICFGEAIIDRLFPINNLSDIHNNSSDFFGGAPANVACALAKLGVDVGFIGKLGIDEHGNNFRNLLFDKGINISCLQKDQYLPTRIVRVDRDLNGERSFGGFLGEKGKGFADQAIDMESLVKELPEHINNLKWLVLGTIPLASKKSSESLYACLELILSNKIRVALDVNWRPTFWDPYSSTDLGPTNQQRKFIQPLLEMASLVKLSKEEAIWFFDETDSAAISSSLPQNPDVVVTDGPLPINWILGGVKGLTNPINFKEVVDTTGAGDAFLAGLIFKLIEENPSNKAAKESFSFAAACGAIVTSGKGAIEPQPTLNKVQELLQSDVGQ